MKPFDCDHEYVFKRPLAVKISSIMAVIAVAFTVALWLPVETNFVLAVLCIAACASLADRLHFACIEKPAISRMIAEHMEEYHMNDLRKLTRQGKKK